MVALVSAVKLSLMGLSTVAVAFKTQLVSISSLFLVLCRFVLPATVVEITYKINCSKQIK